MEITKEKKGPPKDPKVKDDSQRRVRERVPQVIPETSHWGELDRIKCDNWE